MKTVEKSNNLMLIPLEIIEKKIFLIKGQKVMIDADLSKLYGVATKTLNQAVKRNIVRFPGDFMFKLSKIEKDYLVTNCDHLKKLKYSTVMPNVFTEQGIAMLSTVLNSEKAIQVNIAIMRAFVKLRQIISINKELAQKISELENKIGQHDQDIISLFNAINQILRYDGKPKGKIGFV